jgi:hypothetical protein
MCEPGHLEEAAAARAVEHPRLAGRTAEGLVPDVGGHHRRPDLATGQNLLRLAGGLDEALGVRDEELNSRLARGGDHAVARADVHRHGLLDHDVLARAGRLNGGVLVEHVGQQHVHDVHIVALEQRIQAGDAVAAEVVGVLRHAILVDVAGGDEADALCGLQRVPVAARDAAESNDADAVGAGVCLSGGNHGAPWYTAATIAAVLSERRPTGVADKGLSRQFALFPHPEESPCPNPFLSSTRSTRSPILR